MHKDKPAGLFDFPARSVKHAVWMGLAAGIFLSFLVHVGLVVWRADPDGVRRGVEAAENLMTAHHKEPEKATPPPRAAVDY